MQNQLTDEQIISREFNFPLGSLELADALKRFKVVGGQILLRDTNIVQREERLQTEFNETRSAIDIVGEATGLNIGQIKEAANFKIKMQVHEGMPPKV